MRIPKTAAKIRVGGREGGISNTVPFKTCATEHTDADHIKSSGPQGNVSCRAQRSTENANAARGHGAASTRSNRSTRHVATVDFGPEIKPWRLSTVEQAHGCVDRASHCASVGERSAWWRGFRGHPRCGDRG